MVSYKEALRAILADGRKGETLRLLKAKGELSFAALKKACGFAHNETLSRTLDRMEDLGLLTHTYRHGSAQVYSFYALTPFGEDVVKLLRQLDARELTVKAR